jgi:hypothetical protein
MVCERPLAIHRELVDASRPRGWGSHRLHCDDGPAIVWPDGWGLWSSHGTRVTQQIIEHPETLTPKQILEEPNAEVRRVMVERFGADRLMREAQATTLDADADQFGRPRTLLRLPIQGDEDIVMVALVNSTAEPDGHHKDYLLRVPPTVRTCAEAVAWTFDLAPTEYLPAVET